MRGLLLLLPQAVLVLGSRSLGFWVFQLLEIFTPLLLGLTGAALAIHRSDFSCRLTGVVEQVLVVCSSQHIRFAAGLRIIVKSD